MSILNRVLVVVAVLCVFCVGWQPVAQEPVRSRAEMQEKLNYSKNILEGMVTEDFSMITKNAEALSKLGEQNWLANPTAEYRTQNQLFWFTAGNVALAGEQKNLDGVTLAYSQMTISCVKCHELLRQE